MKKTTILDYFIMTRPYSILDLFLLFYLSKVLATASILIRTEDLVLFLPVLFMWFFLTLSLEAKHNHSYRPEIKYAVPMFFLFAASYAGILRNIQSAFFIAGMVVSTALYCNKHNNILGHISFLFRGMYQANIFLFSMSLFTTEITEFYYALSVAIGFITASRNLLGDIRDAPFDEFTFNVRFGKAAGYLASSLFLILGAAIISDLFGTVSVIMPIFILAALPLIYDNGYMLHQIAILVTSFTSILLMTFIADAKWMIPISVLFASIISIFIFYSLVPRKSNPIEVIKTEKGILFPKQRTK